MNYQSELSFLINILENMHLPVSILEEPYENAHIHDFGIRKILYPDINYSKYIQTFCTSCRSHVLYKANDEYLFQYLIISSLRTVVTSLILIFPYYRMYSRYSINMYQINKQMCPAQRLGRVSCSQ